MRDGAFESLASQLRETQARILAEDRDMELASLDHLVMPSDPTPKEITDHICLQPGSYTIWAVLHRDAEFRVADLERRLTDWHAKIYLEAKEELDGRPTEKHVDAHIRSSKYGIELKKREKTLARARRDESYLRSVVRAWDQKATLLASLTRMTSEEMRRSMVVVGDGKE